MGQKNPVHIYNMVSVGTIEEGLLDTLASKQELADASLNVDSEIGEVAVSSSTDDLRKRLEKMALPKLAAPVDESSQRRTEAEVARLHQQREDISKATGDLVTAALSLAGNLLGGATKGQPSEASPEQTAKVDHRSGFA